MPKDTKLKAKQSAKPDRRSSKSKGGKPAKTTASKAVSKKELDEAIELLRPALHSHGGDLEVVSLRGGEVKIRLQGACQGCPMAAVTLKQGVEKFLIKRVKGLKKVSAAE